MAVDGSQLDGFACFVPRGNGWLLLDNLVCVAGLARSRHRGAPAAARARPGRRRVLRRGRRSEGAPRPSEAVSFCERHGAVAHRRTHLPVLAGLRAARARLHLRHCVRRGSGPRTVRAVPGSRPLAGTARPCRRGSARRNGSARAEDPRRRPGCAGCGRTRRRSRSGRRRASVGRSAGAGRCLCREVAGCVSPSRPARRAVRRSWKPSRRARSTLSHSHRTPLTGRENLGLQQAVIERAAGGRLNSPPTYGG